jgi:hypothetical protein
MAIRDLTVTFHTDVREWRGKSPRRGFNFPKELAQAFGKKPGEGLTLHLTIESSSGEPVFDDRALLVSGNEITKPKIFRNLNRGEEILVKACDPKPRVRNKKSR